MTPPFLFFIFKKGGHFSRGRTFKVSSLSARALLRATNFLPHIISGLNLRQANRLITHLSFQSIYRLMVEHYFELLGKKSTAVQLKGWMKQMCDVEGRSWGEGRGRYV